MHDGREDHRQAGGYVRRTPIPAPLRFLITAGPTREPIDPVRYIGNRSSGKMGAALATAAIAQGHAVTLILGPVSLPMPADVERVDVETSQQMHDAVMAHLPSCDVLIMAAAVADYRPKNVSPSKLGRLGNLTLELEPTTDIVAAAAQIKSPHQRIVGFSLEHRGDLDRAREKMLRKRLDLMVFNPTETMDADAIEATLLTPDGQAEALAASSKTAFAQRLIDRAVALVGRQ
ncbi:MAG TPA: phosphopantothenoylcysteine decarboxylase [Tepidisphaeraceae bacterium]|nr:phosphopantothenoylcysteine decarboxylase [Tepidisphaeraceae bacterium]